MADTMETPDRVFVLRGTMAELRAQLIDRIEETGAEVIRIPVGRLEIAVVLPGEGDSITDDEGTALCAAMDQLGNRLLVCYGPNGVAHQAARGGQ